MTAAQKSAKEKFKKAIAIRSKTGVSLKEAFAQVYGKKVGAVKKKKAAPKKKAVKKVVKKAAPKKAAKKVVQKSKPRYSAKEHKHWGIIPEHKRRVNGVTKKKKVSEQSILNKIHKVKNEVNSLDELQHKHMIGSIDKYKNLQNEIKNYDAAIKKLRGNIKYGLTHVEKMRAKLFLKRLMNAKNELKTHAAQLKKVF
jgi:hypothetical protein